MPGIVHTLSTGIQPYHPGEAIVIFENGNWYNTDKFNHYISPTTEQYISINSEGELVFVPIDDLTHDTGISLSLVQDPPLPNFTILFEFTPNIPEVLGGRAFMQYGTCTPGADGCRCMTEGYQRGAYIDIATNIFEDNIGNSMLVGYTNRNHTTDGLFIAGNHFKIYRILGFITDFSTLGFN